MGVIAEKIPRGCQGLFTPVSLGYPLSVFSKNSTLMKNQRFFVKGPSNLQIRLEQIVKPESLQTRNFQNRCDHRVKSSTKCKH